METFLMEVNNLGPVKRAEFRASRFNVLCGKNNTGKTICLHTVFCFFKYWRSQLQLEAKPELVRALLQGERVSFDMEPYLKKFNRAIEHTMPQFVDELPKYLNRNPSHFKDCSIHIKFSEEYLASILTKKSIRVRNIMSSSYVMRLRKEPGVLSAKVWIESVKEGKAPYPQKSAVSSAINSLLSFALFEQLLPKPHLLTAERSGSIMYGDGLRTSTFMASQEQKNEDSEPWKASVRYSRPHVAELEEIWSAQSSPSGKRDLSKYPEMETLVDTFNKEVAGGVYENKNNRMYYTQDGTGKTVLIHEASTSVRALSQICSFLDREATAGDLLMIDEPELNLHPERQRALTRFLSMLVSYAGIDVVISTHSDCIVRELNTLLVLGSNPKRYQAVMQEYGYSDKEILAPDNAACGVVDSGSIEQIAMEGERGITIPSFDAAYDKINAVQNAIVAQWESQEEGQ